MKGGKKMVYDSSNLGCQGKGENESVNQIMMHEFRGEDVLQTKQEKKYFVE